MSQLYVSDTAQVVARNGVSALFKPGVPRPLRPSLVEAAIGAGVRPADGKAPELPSKTSDRKTPEQIAASIRQIMALGNKADFTANGLIRKHVLEKEVGHSISVEDRDAAMALVAAVQADD